MVVADVDAACYWICSRESGGLVCVVVSFVVVEYANDCERPPCPGDLGRRQILLFSLRE